MKPSNLKKAILDSLYSLESGRVLAFFLRGVALRKSDREVSTGEGSSVSLDVVLIAVWVDCCSVFLDVSSYFFVHIIYPIWLLRRSVTELGWKCCCKSVFLDLDKGAQSLCYVCYHHRLFRELYIFKQRGSHTWIAWIYMCNSCLVKGYLCKLYIEQLLYS